MSASLDKEQTENINKRLSSLRIIKKTVEDMGATCEIDWQTDAVKIDGPLPDLAYAIAIEAALAKVGGKKEYNMDEDNNVFIDSILPDGQNEPLH